MAIHWIKGIEKYNLKPNEKLFNPETREYIYVWWMNIPSDRWTDGLVAEDIEQFAIPLKAHALSIITPAGNFIIDYDVDIFLSNDDIYQINIIDENLVKIKEYTLLFVKSSLEHEAAKEHWLFLGQTSLYKIEREKIQDFFWHYHTPQPPQLNIKGNFINIRDLIRRQT